MASDAFLSLGSVNKEACPSIASTTPQSKYDLSPTKAAFDTLPGLKLSLKAVLGTTTVSASCFDCVPRASLFATCAGSVAVLSQVDEHLNLTHRFLRSNLSGNFIPWNTSQYESSLIAGGLEARSRQVVSLKNSGHGTKSAGASPTALASSSPKRSNNSESRQRVKTITCISLSPDGKFLAVGEVSRRLLLTTLYTKIFRLVTHHGSCCTLQLLVHLISLTQRFLSTHLGFAVYHSPRTPIGFAQLAIFMTASSFSGLRT